MQESNIVTKKWKSLVIPDSIEIWYIYYFYTHNVNLHCYYDQQISIEWNKANKDLVNWKEYTAKYDLSKREGLTKLTEEDINSEYFKLEIWDPYKWGYDKIMYKMDWKKTELDIILSNN